jgi:hypothetical protein
MAGEFPLTLVTEMEAYGASPEMVEAEQAAEADQPVTIKDVLAFRQALIDIPRILEGQSVHELGPMPEGLDISGEQKRAYQVGWATVEHAMEQRSAA